MILESVDADGIKETALVRAPRLHMLKMIDAQLASAQEIFPNARSFHPDVPPTEAGGSAQIARPSISKVSDFRQNRHRHNFDFLHHHHQQRGLTLGCTGNIRCWDHHIPRDGPVTVIL
jgi:hypothetical protein